MSEGPTPTLKVACPGCGQQFVVRAEMRGKTLKCKGCEKVFRLAAPASAAPAAPSPAQVAPRAAAPVAPAPAPVAAAPAPAAPASAAPVPAPAAAGAGQNDPSGNCAICQCEIAAGEPSTSCPACAGSFHTDCWEYNKGCGFYGCSEAPPTEGLNSIEIPASHWGKSKKQCPKCTKEILAAAVRCKHCGATFETANPQQRDAYHEHEANRAKLPIIKAAVIGLLIFSLIPCTAPIAAVGGTIWYVTNRKTIAMLPRFHSALCKIAVGVSIVITVLLIAFTVLNSTFG